MCHKVTCRQCGLATWSGCGNHVEQALRGVPKAQRCQGHAKEAAKDAREPGGLFARIFGR